MKKSLTLLVCYFRKYLEVSTFPGCIGEDFCLSIFVPVCALTRQEVLHCGKLHWEHVSNYQQNPIHDETLSIALHEYCILAVGTIMLQHQYGILLSQDNYYSIWIVVQSR